MKTAREKYNARSAKHSAIEVLAKQLVSRLQQPLRRCRTNAKKMLQGVK